MNKFKIIILFFLLLVSTMNLFSQNAEKTLKRTITDSDKLKDSTVYYVWDTIYNYWAKSWKEIYNNSNNKLSLTTGYEINKTTFQWNNSWKYSYSYGTNDKVSQWISNDWVNNFWVNYCKATYVYNTNSKVSQINGFDYYAVTLVWIPSWKEVYTYNQQQNLSQWLIYDWNSTSNTWINSWKGEYIYLTNNKDDAYTFYNWNTTSQTWEAYEKGNYNYSMGNNIVELTISEFVDGNWIISSREVFTDDSKSTTTIRISYKWDVENLIWEYENKYVYYWATTTSISEPENEVSMSVYPNPSSDFVNIKLNSNVSEIDDIELYNAIGQRISIENMIEYETDADFSTFKINLSEMTSGVYFIIVNSENNIYSQTIILQ